MPAHYYTVLQPYGSSGIPFSEDISGSNCEG